MNPRPKPLTIPATPRYWTAESPHGPMVFRHPYYAHGAAVLLYASATHVDPATDERPLQLRYAQMLPAAGAVIGACWWHPTQALAAAFPAAPDDAALAAFGAAVADELQEAGWDMMQIAALFSDVMAAFAHRQSLVGMAEDRASFFAPAPEVSTSS